MDLRYLRFFIAVAEESNFTRAADRLHTVQPSLSNQIKRLEEFVGAPLLVRDKHKTHLTAAGRVFLQHSYKLLEEFDVAIEATRTSARSENGHLTLGYLPGTEMIIFPNVLPVLHQRFPMMNFRLVSEHTPQLIIGLQNSLLDLVFGEVIDDPAITSEVVSRLRMVAAIPVDHPLAVWERIAPAELAKFPIVAPTRALFPDAGRVINEFADQAGTQFRTIAEVDSVLASLNAVRSGLGVALVPAYAKQVAANVLIRPLDWIPEPSLSFNVSYRKDNAMLQGTVLDSLRGCLRELHLDILGKAEF